LVSILSAALECATNNGLNMSESSEPLGLTVHSLPDAGVAVQRQQASGRLKMLIVLAICTAPVLLSYFFYYVVRPNGSATAYSTLIQPAHPMPALVGRAEGGELGALQDQKGQWLLVTVGGGHCDPACERRLFMQRQLREMTGKERDRVDKLWLVIDDVPVAPAMLKALEATPAMHILRLPREAVAAWLQPAPGHALEDHLYIVDPMGDWMMRAPADADPNKLKRDIDRLLRASAGWHKPAAKLSTLAPAASGAGAAASR
jgi:hypothetical protein